ncbi:iron complex transport system substrate-binding protein [Paraburkholderia eburnea]|uniref:Iron complex transport system substrate-binding protein n=1 Tax=Paraburkholderia eburnea TaxID=1189126 RepID=A0A2S4LV24_9BURK|nr:ABC transporter substrate-binding protein [Paraburkholderia eburnea]POR46290.1 iron complex transport system substrate-binding protein [Paraburkholderia eburnea]PRZ16243.1 iron complex transport system substrate-binding protein [Paraburkholderia eburnea]
MRRRDFLRGAASAPLAWAGIPMRAHARAAAPRLVVLDWGLAETLLAIGVTPVGAAEVADYNASVVHPLAPPAVADVGLRLAPSLELIQALAPDLILINSSQESQRDMLERIAPVRAFAVYTDAGAPYQHSVDVTRALARLCGCAQAAETLIAAVARTLAGSRERLAAHPDARAQPLYVTRFFDARHVGVYGARSLFQDVMDALGVRNAWRGNTDYWGIGVAGLEALAAPDARMLYFEPLPPGVARTLADNRLWHALPAVAARRVAPLPPFWGFGMLPSAARFADVLTTALTTVLTSAQPGSSSPLSS